MVVVPVSNPDGFDLSRTDGEYSDLRELNPNDPLSGSTSVLATPGQTYKRKNCRVVDGEDTPDGSCAATATSNGGFGVGVDLNRNYGGFWGGPGAAPTEPNPSTLEAGPADPTYRGASAFSEPETKNIRDLIASRQTTMMISNHTFSNLVLRPNGVNPNTLGADGKPVGDSPDERGLKHLGCQDDVPRTATPTSTAGSSTTPPAPPRTGPTTPPAATATPSRSAPTSSTRRSRRSSTSTSARASTPARATVRPT